MNLRKVAERAAIDRDMSSAVQSVRDALGVEHYTRAEDIVRMMDQHTWFRLPVTERRRFLADYAATTIRYLLH